MDAYIGRFFVSYLVTVVSETAALVPVMRFLFRNRTPVWKLAAAGVFASTGTIPWLWFVLPEMIHDYAVLLSVGEISVTLAEALFYRIFLEVSMVRSLTLSLICNILSITIGFAMNRLF